MPNKKSEKPMKFKKNGLDVEIRKVDDRTELEIDGVVHELRYLDNGRPYTRAYVNSMVKNEREYAEKFIEFAAAQSEHWAKVAKARAEKESKK